MKSLNKEFTLLSVESILEILDKNNYTVERMFTREGFAINLDIVRKNAPSGLIEMIQIPFYINDNRILRVLSGSVRLDLNLTEYELSAGDIVLLREGASFEVKEVSEDASAEALVFFHGAINFSYSSDSVVLVHPQNEEWNEISHIFYTIYSFAARLPYRPEIVEPLIQSLVNYILTLERRINTTQDSTASSIFNRFITELNLNKNGKMSVTYYADRLCISPQYLSRIVSQVSGKTASDWINKAVITEARILLRNTSSAISDIAESLNFPNDSFFCRFFKRKTGQTPTEYRKSAQK